MLATKLEAGKSFLDIKAKLMVAIAKHEMAGNMAGDDGPAAAQKWLTVKSWIQASIAQIDDYQKLPRMTKDARSTHQFHRRGSGGEEIARRRR